MIAVGSDLFRETIDYLKQDVLTNLVSKKPYTQGHTAAKHLIEHLLREDTSEQDVIHIGSEIIFQSNLPNYDNPFFRGS